MFTPVIHVICVFATDWIVQITSLILTATLLEDVPNPEPEIVTKEPLAPLLGEIDVTDGDNVESYVNVADGNVKPLDVIDTVVLPATLSGVKHMI